MSNPIDTIGKTQATLSVFPAPIDSKNPGRAPSSSDINYPIGQSWVFNGVAYMLVAKSAGAATWVIDSSAIIPDSLTDHAVLVGNGTGPIEAIAVGATGEVLIGATAADPAFGALGVNSGLAVNGVVIAEANAAFEATAAGTDGQLLTGNTLANPSFQALGVNSGLTDHGVVLGQGAAALVATAVASDGQLLIGATGADPAPASLTSTDGTIAITQGPNTLDISASTGVTAPLQYREVTLTATEVKALATTPITLVSAPAAGATIQFLGAALKLNYGGSNVFTEAGDNLGIKYTDASGVQVCGTIESGGFIDQAANTYTNAIPIADAIVAATGAEAQPLVLDNLGSNFAGNAADDNTLTVRVYYTVQTLA